MNNHTGSRRTVDGELGGFAESSTSDVLCYARVVGGIAEPHLTDDEVAFIRDDDVDVCISIHRLVVFQPVDLHSHNRQSYGVLCEF